MSEISNNFNGRISIGIPGKQGEHGERGSYRFFGDTNTETSENKIILYEGNGIVGYANKPSSEDIVPKINDTVLYKSKDKILLYNIIDVIEDSKVYVEPIDELEYESSEEQSSKEYNIAVNVTKTVSRLGTYKLPMSSSYYGKLYQDVVISASNKPVFVPYDYWYYDQPVYGFDLVSLNESTFGNIRIMLEFITNHVSPGVYSLIPDLFKGAGEAKEYTHGDPDSSVYRYPISFRGNSFRYGYYGYIDDNNFYANSLNEDNEPIENFYIMIKDFGEENESSFIHKDINLDPNVVKNIYYYTCNLVAFVNTYGEFYEKILISKIDI